MTKERTDIHKMIDKAVAIAETTQAQLDLRLDQAVSGTERRKIAATCPKAKALRRASQCASLTATHLGKVLET